jgi:ABC-type branched-subunit amino acid transport system permease subunit
MGAWEYYLIVLLVYLGTDLLAAWGLNLEFGVTGVANLAYIVTIAAGAYTYAICTLGPPAATGNFQQYVGGFYLAFPVAIVAGVLAGSVVGVLIGITGLKRLRQDYQAIAMLVVSLMAATVVSADTPIPQRQRRTGVDTRSVLRPGSSDAAVALCRHRRRRVRAWLPPAAEVYHRPDWTNPTSHPR